MKPKNTNRSQYRIAEGIDRSEFEERVSKEIMGALQDPACSCPVGAKKQWIEMSQTDKLAFVSASLECFYWIYIARKNKEKSAVYPSWEEASIDQKVGTAAGFCSFILGTEFEDYGADKFPNWESFQTEWVN